LPIYLTYVCILILAVQCLVDFVFEMAKVSKKHLSSHLLEMKFMKKSKDDRKKLEEQDKYAQVFESDQIKLETGARVTYQPNQALLEDLVFPRRSYGGSSPALEKLMVEMDGVGGSDSKGVDKLEADVSDVQMAGHYTSLVGTVGRKFQSKRQRSPSGEAGTRTPSRPPALKRVKEFLKPAED